MASIEQLKSMYDSTAAPRMTILPEWWEERTRANGQGYYTDHSTGTDHNRLPALASHTIDETAWVYNTVSRARSLRSDMEGVELNLWATSIPQVGNTDDSLKDTMKYYMYVKKINRLISLQSCSLGYHPSEEGDPHGHGFSCPSTPAEKDKEDRVW